MTPAMYAADRSWVMRMQGTRSISSDCC
jgi:hypothetical protein